MLGRPLEVDLSTLKARGPMRMRVACRNPSKLNRAVQFFHKSLGYNVGIRIEEPRVAAPAPHPPSPPHQDDDDMDDNKDEPNSPSEEECRALGDKDIAKAVARSKSAPATSQGRGSAAASGAEPTATLTARGASEPPALPGQGEMQIDQYRSNMGKTAPWPVPLVVLEQARATEEARGRQVSPAEPAAEARVDPPMSLPVDSSTLLTTGSDYDSEDSLGSPAKNKTTATGREDDEEGGKVDDMDDRCAQRPVLMETTVPRARRTRTVPAGPARKSARLQGPASAIPIMQRAQGVHRGQEP